MIGQEVPYQECDDCGQNTAESPGLEIMSMGDGEFICTDCLDDRYGQE